VKSWKKSLQSSEFQKQAIIPDKADFKQKLEEAKVTSY
jgi:hypothetical protein